MSRFNGFCLNFIRHFKAKNSCSNPFGSIGGSVFGNFSHECTPWMANRVLTILNQAIALMAGSLALFSSNLEIDYGRKNLD